MHPTRSFTVFSCVLLGLLLAVAVVPAGAEEEEEERYSLNVAVLCEAWRVTMPHVLEEIEAITERRPGAAEEVRKVLQEGGGKRLARILTPATDGRPVQLSDLRKIPVKVTVPSQGGATVGGFGGFLEVGAVLELVTQVDDDGTYQIELELKVMGGTAAGEGQPQTQSSTTLQARFIAPLGALRMVLSRVQGDDAVVVFLRVTALDAAPLPLPVQGAGAGPFREDEIERFRALKLHVDGLERMDRHRQMTARQLARLDIELTEEQIRAVGDLWLKFRDAVREGYRTSSAAGEDREALQAVLDEARQEFSAALQLVLDAEVAEQVLTALGRSSGFGRARVEAPPR